MARHALCALALAVGLVHSAAADSRVEPINMASMLAHSCFSCHGTYGTGSLKIPELKGLDREDFKATMQGFKQGTEQSTIMGRHAGGYTDEEIALLADYFAGLE